MIGDVQGCDEALGRLMDEIGFSPSRDTLYLLGDLVNRGPDSLAVLRRLMALEGAAHCLLGNHDLHLLAVAHGVRKPHRSDTLADILNAPDRKHLLDWLRTRSMALQAHGWLMVHAGVLPQWDAAQTLALAGELEAALRSHWPARQAHAHATLAQWQHRLSVAVSARCRHDDARLRGLEAALNALSPQRVLDRGYAWLSTPSGHVIASVSDVQPGEAVQARLADGVLQLNVESGKPV